MSVSMHDPVASLDGMNIWVVDNLLPLHLHHATYEYCTNSLYSPKHVSSNHHQHVIPRLAAHLTDEQVENHWLTGAFFLNASRFGAAVDVERAYINLGNSATVTVEHVDDSQPGLSMIYYPNKMWDTCWGGETLFFDQQQEIIYATLPKPNRAVFFDPRILHTARPPTVLTTETRYTFVYKGVLK